MKAPVQTPDSVSEGTVLSRNKEMLVNEAGNECMMMSIETGKYFGLNKTGAFIWQNLESPKSVAQLIPLIKGKFDIDEKSCREDILPFIVELIHENIIIAS